MIGRVRGRVLERRGNTLVLDVSGVGYKIATTPSTAARLGKPLGGEADLFTHLSVKETSLELYGFPTRDELEFFELLITISGIGPKTALSILSVADPTTIRSAISSGDTSYLTKVSGIGKKSAERIVVELSDKIGALESESRPALKEEADALDALKALGYSAAEARGALKQIPKDVAGTGERLKAALKVLGS